MQPTQGKVQGSSVRSVLFPSPAPSRRRSGPFRVRSGCRTVVPLALVGFSGTTNSLLKLSLETNMAHTAHPRAAPCARAAHRAPGARAPNALSHSRVFTLVRSSRGAISGYNSLNRNHVSGGSYSFGSFGPSTSQFECRLRATSSAEAEVSEAASSSASAEQPDEESNNASKNGAAAPKNGKTTTNASTGTCTSAATTPN